MITFLRGALVKSLPSHVTLDVNGVGYEIHIPLSTYDALAAPPATVTLLTHLHIREDAHMLFGFFTSAERDLFRLLIQRVSGVGPKMAMAVLSGISVDDFKSAVVRGDVDFIARVKGLGKKTAERVVLELKDKVGVAAAWETSALPTAANTAFNDAILALIHLGYKQIEARKAVDQLQKSGQFEVSTTTDEILRAALRMLN